MNRFVLTTCFAILMATYLVEAEREKRNLGDTAAALYSSAFSSVMPDATKEACRGLGWVDGPNAKNSGGLFSGRKRRSVHMVKRGLLDAFVPTALAHAVGVIHKEIFPESMQKSFCENVGMVKEGITSPTVVVVQATQQAPSQTISGYWAPYNGQQVLVTPQGQVYAQGGAYLGTQQQLGVQLYA